MPSARRAKFAGVIDVQIVAFPQLGLARNPEAVDLMWQAMARGATVVGGMPHGERDMDDAARATSRSPSRSPRRMMPTSTCMWTRQTTPTGTRWNYWRTRPLRWATRDG